MKLRRFSFFGAHHTTQRFAAAAGMDYGSLRPGIYVHLLLDDYLNEQSRRFVTSFLTDEMRFVFGLSLLVTLR